MKFRTFSALFVLSIVIFFGSLPASAAVNDFYFESFDAEYTLGKDAENRSTLAITETLTAVFPNTNQNHGIERAIPNEYDGHPVSLAIKNVTKNDGSAWKYTTYESNGNTVLRIGDAATYVKGEQTFIISYSLRDVTKQFAEGDEWFWDINGTEWAVPFNAVRATIRLDDTVAGSFDGRLACFSGSSGSTEQQCSIEAQNTIIQVTSTQKLNAYENISFAVGFAPNTFSGYVAPPTPWWMWVLLVAVVPALYIIAPIFVLIWSIKKWRTYGRDAKKQTTVIAQYLPPKNTSMLRADLIINAVMRPKAVSASIIDLAVRHYVKIWQSGKKFDVELVKPIDDLPTEDKKVLDIIFGNTPAVGTKQAIADMSSAYTSITNLGKEVYAAAITDGLMTDTRPLQKRMTTIGWILVLLSLFSGNILMLVASIVMLSFAYYMPARTAAGADLKTYLDGTKLYMEVAEAERLRMLQAPDTAVAINASDTTQLVKLYERLLPLAVLYSIEKQWAEQFAALYTPETQPSWYSNDTALFSGLAFANALSSFDTAATTSFSPPSSSGSSGFSSGGGSSGGGGGGGGGGGW